MRQSKFIVYKSKFTNLYFFLLMRLYSLFTLFLNYTYLNDKTQIIIQFCMQTKVPHLITGEASRVTQLPLRAFPSRKCAVEEKPCTGWIMEREATFARAIARRTRRTNSGGHNMGTDNHASAVGINDRNKQKERRTCTCTHCLPQL